MQKCDVLISNTSNETKFMSKKNALLI